MGEGFVDLRSDTVTRPSAEMREVMARAEVGDDTLGDDPTTRRLEVLVSELLGKEAALFFPSGIMANQTALCALAAPGTEVILEAEAHILTHEESAAAVLSGLQLRAVPTSDGQLTGPMVAGAIRPRSPFLPVAGLIALENTHLDSGGRIMPLEVARDIREVADRHGLPIHLDGSRLWHACVETGLSPAELSGPADTVMVSLCKGLGAPIGAVLAGPAEVMERSWRIRRRFGGGLRQSGILAAAGIYAIEHHMRGLAEDHARAKELALRLSAIPGLEAASPETNIVFIHVLESCRVVAAKLIEGLESRGVLMSDFGPTRLRAVTHRDVTDDGIERAVQALEAVVQAA